MELFLPVRHSMDACYFTISDCCWTLLLHKTNLSTLFFRKEFFDPLIFSPNCIIVKLFSNCPPMFAVMELNCPSAQVTPNKSQPPRHTYTCTHMYTHIHMLIIAGIICSYVHVHVRTQLANIHSAKGWRTLHSIDQFTPCFTSCVF